MQWDLYVTLWQGKHAVACGVCLTAPVLWSGQEKSWGRVKITNESLQLHLATTKMISPDEHLLRALVPACRYVQTRNQTLRLGLQKDEPFEPLHISLPLFHQCSSADAELLFVWQNHNFAVSLGCILCICHALSTSLYVSMRSALLHS